MHRLKERTEEFLKATSQLERAVQQPKDEFIRDSVIQRFEFSYELSWKMLKLKLEEEGLEARTPRQVFQESLVAGFIQDGNLWSELQKQRNLTTHTYDESLAESVYQFIAEQGLALFQQLACVAKQW
ncbi:HI0074 family nucleotidyltransferase substrate-binding subunit [Lacimicrobium alkaliphilum]|uniref:Nucleotidyltransferase n=1 Tax=Lacimicrobium alkaliphilum TaxID=1526571 RepID=A0ABQ1R836_9ALTE|nr:HI0074 family nucleotidyltransferase substrate-binding subunit [Lacimicrobium alkaliphilum]GGD57785.1 nucleotidyltransferase [Lacimicrobium alkaliphilum]